MTIILNLILKYRSFGGGVNSVGVLLISIFFFVILALLFASDPFISSDNFTSQLFILPFLPIKGIIYSMVNFIRRVINRLNKVLAHIEIWSSNSGDLFKLLTVTSLGAKAKKVSVEVLEPHQDMKVLLSNLFSFLNTLEAYTDINAKKVLVTACDTNNIDLTLNKAVLIKPNMSFDEIYEEFLPTLTKINESHYNIETSAIIRLEVVIINLDFYNDNNTLSTPSNPFNMQKRAYHQSRNTIAPLKNRNVNARPFATLDIETMEVNGVQQPVLISLTWSTNNTQTFLLNPSLPFDVALDNLWEEFFDFIESELPKDINTIFVHNLGGFDGIYIYKYLAKNYELNVLNSIIDGDNKFINICLKLDNRTITWLDSYRIFPVSLNELCSVFEVQGKLTEYNLEFNNLVLFKDRAKLLKFIKYCKQDTISLFNALSQAQSKFISDYNIDITRVLSTSNLALKIFRSKFLNINIPVLKKTIDNFIRPGYFGGSTDYYKAYGEDLSHLDVNSLYPLAMKKPMPNEIVKYHKTMDNISMDSVFGFFLAEIESPQDILHPILPYKDKSGQTIHPVGKWKGVYFSEELKNAVKYGYTVKLISGYEFSKTDLFPEYVDHFYQIKKTATGSTKFISKLLLNTLYGVFGRKQELIQTINIHPDDLDKYAATHDIKNYIPISEDIMTLLLYQNLDYSTIGKIGFNFEDSISNKSYIVKSNVAIAAAVTAYGRIHMSQFKNNSLIELYYTDTDSIIFKLLGKLPLNIIGEALGQMKDELNGLLIKEAYFLGIKQYGYCYLNSNGDRIEKSVFAGVTRDSLSFQEITDIFKGKTIVKSIINRFFRSMNDLSVNIKDITIKVSFKPNKQLINNNYLPIKISSNNKSLFTRFKFLMNKYYK
jgi:hypothetical protein